MCSVNYFQLTLIKRSPASNSSLGLSIDNLMNFAMSHSLTTVHVSNTVDISEHKKWTAKNS